MNFFSLFKRDNFPRTFVLGSIATLLSVLCFYSIFRRFDGDEFESIHSAWKILHGQTIYVDFFQNHNPFFYYMLTPIIYFFGETFATLLVARLLIFLMFLGIGFATYKICTLCYNKDAGLISVILLYATPVFSIYSVDIRPDVPQILFGMISVLALFLFLQERKLFYLIASALALSGSILFLQKAAFVVAGIGLATLLLTIFKQVSVKDFFIYWITFSTPIATFIGYLYFTNSLTPYIQFAYLWNSHLGTIPNYGALFTSFSFTYQSSPVVWLLYILGVLFFTKTILQKIIGLLSLVVIGSLILIPAPFQHYLAPAIPFVAILAAGAAYDIFAEKKQLLIATIIFTMAFPIGANYIRRTIVSPSTKQWAKMSAVLRGTTPEDYVMYSFKCDDGDRTYYSWNLFRKDHNFFWLWPVKLAAAPYEKLTGKTYDYNVYEAIETYKHKFICKSTIMVDSKDPLEKILQMPQIKDHYVQSEIDEDLLVRIN